MTGEYLSTKLETLRGCLKSPKPKSIFPTVPNEWPVWAKALKQFSIESDEGIGDVVARIIGEENSMAFEAWHLKTFGKPCNCPRRRDRWNKLYPLK